MKEEIGDLWMMPADFRVITTNGYVKNNGEAVMGRGCAREATVLYPGIALALGNSITKYGNHVFLFRKRKLITFPVKHHWHQEADMLLIRQSVAEFKAMIRKLPAVTRYVMVRPGCGNGRLTWEDVKPLLIDLPDTVTIVNYT